MSEGSNGHHRLTAEELADRTRFRFREKVLDIPELGGEITLKTLSVREREILRAPVEEAAGKTDEGDPTEAAIEAAAKVFSLIVLEPNVTEEEATGFLGDWPVEAFDRITDAYADLIGSREDEKAAYAEFQPADGPEVSVPPSP